MIIGIVGFIGSGKGTVADILVSEYNFEKASFADSLKDAVSVIFDWPRSLLEGDTDESRVFREQEDAFWTERFGYSVTPRLMLQKMGTEACREGIHDNIWINSLERRMQNMENVVIADVRFPNEIDAIRKAGGTIVRVKRGDDPEWFIELETASEKKKKLIYALCADRGIHISEYAWADTKFDFIINNNGTKESLTKTVDYMIEQIRRKT